MFRCVSPSFGCLHGPLLWRVDCTCIRTRHCVCFAVHFVVRSLSQFLSNGGDRGLRVITATAVCLRLWCLFAFAYNELTASLWRVDHVTSWLVSETLQILSADLMGKMGMWQCRYATNDCMLMLIAYLHSRHLPQQLLVGVWPHPPHYQWQRAVAVCPARLTASRSEWRRPADCLQSCSGVEADVCLACLERLRNGDRPQTSRRVPATLQMLWLCSSDLPASEELLDEFDDRLFSKTLNNSTHTLHTLLPPLSSASQYYHLRRRMHDRQLPTLNSHLCIKKLRNTSTV